MRVGGFTNNAVGTIAITQVIMGKSGEGRRLQGGIALHAFASTIALLQCVCVCVCVIMLGSTDICPPF
jgi:hypothetical protein